MVKPNSLQSQRGAYSILTVFVLIMSMGAMGVLAVGHMAWEKPACKVLLTWLP